MTFPIPRALISTHTVVGRFFSPHGRGRVAATPWLCLYSQIPSSCFGLPPCFYFLPRISSITQGGRRPHRGGRRPTTASFSTITSSTNDGVDATTETNDEEEDDSVAVHGDVILPSSSSEEEGEDRIDVGWRILRGPDVEFETGRIANLTDMAILGSSGRTVVLATVATAFSDTSNDKETVTTTSTDMGAVARHLRRRCTRGSSSTMLPLTVDYRQRHHAVGRIPSTVGRSDNRRPTESETLASRAIDRALRPLLRAASTKEGTVRDASVGAVEGGATTSGGHDDNDTEGRGKTEGDISAIHLSCSVQACPVAVGGGPGGGGHPVALALNAASMALRHRLTEPIAAVSLCLLDDGTTVLVDSCSPGRLEGEKGATTTTTTSHDPQQVAGELLFAGTRDSIVMMEFSGMVTEPQLVGLIRVAHDSIQPLLEMQEKNQVRTHAKTYLGRGDRKGDNQHMMAETKLRSELGLEDPVVLDSDREVELFRRESEKRDQSAANQIYTESNAHVKSEVRSVALRLFGAQPETDNDPSVCNTSAAVVTIHSEDVLGPLLGKGVRARREHLFHEEIKRLLIQFHPADPDLGDIYRSLSKQNPSIVNTLADAIHSSVSKEAMRDSAMKYQSRADGRGRGQKENGCVTIRPLSIEVPALPDVVHGSALFTRGETQVLCTVTLGPPKDGILLTDPYSPKNSPPNEAVPHSDYQDLPVGSLRYLKTQEYLESDLNSRKIRADREQTGDSGTLKDRRRAFLQYDFPAFSKGEVQTGPSSASRREIGHGALAEKAILPILPPASEFPYAIRMTSEVTSSNGSSSMASVVGITLALLDAGVPITAPAAGVSVGVVLDDNDGSHQLLLDLTGTEDHYGLMDFKIAGTASHVTGLQLDVKQPLPLAVIEEALMLAKDGRIEIIREMAVQSTKSSNGVITDLIPRPELKESAPAVAVVKFEPSRKKDLLGPGGVVIRQMEDRFNVSCDLAQEGRCLLFGDDREMVRKAKATVMDLVSDVAVGFVYQGTVIELKDFGVIIELLRNKEGLMHVSELATKEEIRNHPTGTFGLVNSMLRVGQSIDVVCTAVDPVQGTIRLRPATKKETL